MNTAAYFCLYVPDDDEPVDGTEDYDEAVALCRALVEEDGNPSAEVRCGDRICCATDRDDDGRLRVRDVGEADAARRVSAADEATGGDGALSPAPSRLRRPSRAYVEEDVTHTLRSSGLADRRRVPGAASTRGRRRPNPPDPRPHPRSGRAPREASALARSDVILGEDPARPATVWLGL